MTQKQRYGGKAPWASGPGEILQHGLSLLYEDSDRNRRLAMLSIDNAVELMMKTFLGLPKRVTGLTIGRKDYAEFSESFPALLEALEEYAGDRLVGIELGDIEWYHRLRNQLYHQGNGLTVELDKVKVYSELAKVLFRNLFGFELQIASPSKDDLTARFVASWAGMERAVRVLWLPLAGPSRDSMQYHFVGNIDTLVTNGVIDKATATEINQLRALRNKVVHGASAIDDALEQSTIRRMNELTKLLEGKAEKSECIVKREQA